MASLITRRRFLGRSGAAAVAAPLLASAPVCAAERGTPAGDRITVGFVGVGSQGGYLLKALLGRRDVQVLAVCDVDRRFREDARQKTEAAYADRLGQGAYGGIGCYGDFRELVTRPDLDTVVVATPDHWHALISVWACRHGKDVYCEKPLSLTIPEGRAMVAAARRYDRVFQTGTMQRSSFGHRRACELVRSGRIGTLQAVQVGSRSYRPPAGQAGPPQPVPEGLDWDMYLGPAPWRPYHAEVHPLKYRLYRDFSGGTLTDYGAHDYDIAQWGIGADTTGPVEVVPPRGRGQYLTWRYGNGVLVHNGGSRLGTITFTGTEGRVGCGRWYLRTDPPELAGQPLCAEDVHLHESLDHMGDFLHSVRTRRRPVSDVEAGHRSVSVPHLGNIALQLGRPLKWDPDAEAFVGDAEANRLLSRPMREPWRV